MLEELLTSLIWKLMEIKFEFLNAIMARWGCQSFLWHWIEKLTFFSSSNNFISGKSSEISQTKSVPEVNFNKLLQICTLSSVFHQQDISELFRCFQMSECILSWSFNLICYFSYWKTNSGDKKAVFYHALGPLNNTELIHNSARENQRGVQQHELKTQD